jgi:phosphatidylglycerophosphate synthase
LEPNSRIHSVTEGLDAARLRAAVKAHDTWWARLVVGPAANRFVARAARLPWVTPNRITMASLAAGVFAAAAFAHGGPGPLALGALLVQVSFFLDCADGQLARYRGTANLFGSILDRLCDRAKLFAIVFALAFGLERQGTSAVAFPLAFVYVASETMLETYVRSYRRLAAGLAAEAEAATFLRRLRMALRVVDLPLIRLAFADRYFLVSAFALAGRPDLLLGVLAALGLFQVCLRPVYYAVNFRCIAGYWPWNDERPHSLGDVP